MKMFPIAILCAGLGTRLYPITKTLPKSMIEIAGKPFISHQLEILKNNNFTDVCICVGYLGDQIVNFVNSKNFGLNITFAYDGEYLLGTAGSIKKALPLLGDNFFVIYGDSYLELNYESIQQKFIDNKKLALMTIYKNDGKFDKSNVEYKDGKIISYSKENTKGMMHIDYGVSVFNNHAFDGFTEHKFDLKEVFLKMLKEEQLSSYVAKNRFYEIGSFNGIRELNEYLKNKENF
jgi:N-acetyl-alpha-D-muramate 1-phosphate uridylyltransferase